MSANSAFQKKLNDLQKMIMDLDKFVVQEMADRKTIELQKTAAEEKVKLASAKVERIIQDLESLKNNHENNRVA
jgi:hypothetical protein